MLLRTHLAAMVPLRIHELRDQPDWALEEIRAALPDRIQKGADTVQFGGGKRGEAGQSIGAWTTGLAFLALQAEGGVDFQGMHWCAIPHCRAASRFDHADPDWDEPWPSPEPGEPTDPSARPVTTLPDLSTWLPPA
jgi:hypothetical protein